MATMPSALIGALDDARFSRSVGFFRNFCFSHYVLTVGDCAEAVLSQIAGREFFAPSSTCSYMSKDGKTATVKKEAESWYAEFKKKGEKQMLIEAVERGEEADVAIAERLAEKYPAAAIAALAKGVSRAKSSWVRHELSAAPLRFEAMCRFSLLRSIEKRKNAGRSGNRRKRLARTKIRRGCHGDDRRMEQGRR